jgi:hypothetical protein
VFVCKRKAQVEEEEGEERGEERGQSVEEKMTATSSSKPHNGGVEGGGGGAHRRLGDAGDVAARSEYEVEEMGHVVIRVDRGAKRPEVIAGRRGEPGHQDGGKGTSRLRNPTSVVLSDDGTSLIIIDTGNSAIRSLDLSTLEVSTLGGTPSEENTVETWLHMNDDLLSPAGSVSVVKTDGNGVWSTAFSHPVSSYAAELGEGDMTWTVRSVHATWQSLRQQCTGRLMMCIRRA